MILYILLFFFIISASSRQNELVIDNLEVAPRNYQYIKIDSYRPKSKYSEQDEPSVIEELKHT
jgi:hypothetical protein